jgi:hypothetical protein
MDAKTLIAIAVFGGIILAAVLILFLPEGIGRADL